MPRGTFLAQIAAAFLVDVQRNEIHRGMMVLAVPAIAVHKSIDDVLRVRVLEVSCDNRR